MIFSSESLFVLYINLPQLSNFLNSNCPVSPSAGRLFLPHHPLSSARHFEGLCWLMHPDGSCLIVGKGWAFLPVWSRSHKQRLSVFAEAPGQSLTSNFRGRKDPAQPFSCLLASSWAGSSGALTENLHPPSPGDPSDSSSPRTQFLTKCSSHLGKGRERAERLETERLFSYWKQRVGGVMFIGEPPRVQEWTLRQIMTLNTSPGRGSFWKPLRLQWYTLFSLAIDGILVGTVEKIRTTETWQKREVRIVRHDDTDAWKHKGP